MRVVPAERRNPRQKVDPLRSSSILATALNPQWARTRNTMTSPVISADTRVEEQPRSTTYQKQLWFSSMTRILM